MNYKFEIQKINLEHEEGAYEDGMAAKYNTETYRLEWVGGEYLSVRGLDVRTISELAELPHYAANHILHDIDSPVNECYS